MKKTFNVQRSTFNVQCGSLNVERWTLARFPGRTFGADPSHAHRDHRRRRQQPANGVRQTLRPARRPAGRRAVDRRFRAVRIRHRHYSGRPRGASLRTRSDGPRPGFPESLGGNPGRRAGRIPSFATAWKQVGAATEFVAVHDAARPLVRPELVERIFQLARIHGGAACAAPVSDTLKRAGDDLVVTGGVERESLFAVQTPQIFRRDLVGESLRGRVRGRARSDRRNFGRRALVAAKMLLVPNEEPNFKITYPADLLLAEFILRQRQAAARKRRPSSWRRRRACR